MTKLLLLLLAAAALALPAAALAADAPQRQSVTISGKIALVGRGFLKAELTGSADAKAVHVIARAGFVRFVDLGGDLKVRCQGRGDAQGHENQQGQTVFTCVGARGRAEATGSHFQIQGFALRYGIAIPDGYTGTVEGRVKEWQPGQAQGQGQSQGQGQGQGQGQSQGQGSGQSQGSSSSSSLDADLAAALAQS